MELSDLQRVFQTRGREARDNWKLLCPFHDEKSPSFYVHKQSGLANCFGCGKGGRIDKLVAELQGISAQDARKLLDLSTEQLIDQRRKRCDVHTPIYYPESWLAPFKKEIHKYVCEERGFTVATLSSVGALYDPALKRQVFPHRNRAGKLLGVAGRACKGQDPKWLFYWDYAKGRALWMAPAVRQGRGPVIVVEGIFDALWYMQNGYTNVAATLGTKVTMHQVRELRSLTDHVYLALDNDQSGKNATQWLYRRLKRTNDVSFVTYPPGYKDPVGMSKGELDHVVQSAMTPLQYKIHVQRQTV